MLGISSLVRYGAVHKVCHAIFGQFLPLLSHFVTHPGTPPKVRHTSWTPRFLVGLVQKSRTKVLCTNSISIVRGGFCPGGFVRVGFCPFPLLSQYICYNRKLNITLNLILVVGILTAPGQTKESARRGAGLSAICFYCVAVGHMFLLCGARPYVSIVWRSVAVDHMFLLCGARPYVSIVWRSAICFYCVCDHMFS